MTSFILANANGIHNTNDFPDKPQRIFQHLLNSTADFAIITETHATASENPWATVHHAHFSSFSAKQRGCAIVPLKKGVSISEVTTDPKGRFIIATVNTNHAPPVTVCGVYAPNDNQASFIEEVLEVIPAHCSLITGDFNIVTRLADRSPSKDLSEESIRFLNAVTRAGFHDLAPQNSPHTFIHRNGRYTARLDRCLVKKSSQYSACISSLHRYPSSHRNISDHIPIIFHLLLPEPIPRGSPFWRLNIRRLNENSALALTEVLHSRFISHSAVLPQWESIKRQVRDFFSRRDRGLADQGIGFPGEHPIPVSPDPIKDAFEKRLLLGRIKADTARELPTPLLSSLIDYNITSNHIPAVKSPSGDLDSSQSGISNTFRQWFESTFTPKPSTLTPLHRHVPSLPQSSIRALNIPITAQDIVDAASHTKKHSAPGVDGIPYIVYAKVPYLADLLARLIEEALHSGSFPPSWAETIIRPILKPGQDPTLPKSYRPIALICCDWKLFTLILAHRIRPDLPQMFPTHQTGFIPGRSTHLAALRLLTILDSTLESVPTLLDCEKAYDRVSHEWLRYCVYKAGFPSNISQLLLGICEATQGRVITNNRLSRGFLIRSGIRQGDPIAPLLFIITLEPLLVELELRGFQVQAHCDDTAVVLPSSRITDLLDTLTLYERASGAKLNEGKTVILSSERISDCPFEQSTQPERYLGFYISPRKKLIVPEFIVDECINMMTRCKRLPLSLAGRMTVLSSYIRPKLLYRLAISVCPRLDSYIKAERWFLSSSKPFDRETRTIPLFSDTKLRHPAFFFRMHPLDLTVKIRRASTLISAIRSMKAETDLSYMLLNNTPEARLPPPAWRQLREAFFDLLPLLDIPRRRVNKQGNPDHKGKFSNCEQKGS